MRKKSIDVWIYDNSLRKGLGLDCVEALFLGIIQQTQCRNIGCCYLQNKFFRDKLGVKDRWIADKLKMFVDLRQIWIWGRFKTKKSASGFSRHIVVARSIPTYRKFLIRTHNYGVFKIFMKEFVD